LAARARTAEATENGVDDIDPLATEEPAAFNAVTRNEYCVPLVRPVTTKLTPALPVVGVTVIHELPESLDSSTPYPVTGAPPFDDGAVQRRVTELSLAKAAVRVGDPGTFTGDVPTDALAGPSPTGFTAITRKANGTPLVRPVMVARVVEAPTVVAVVNRPPAVDCSMRYDVMDAPPFADGAVQARTTCPSAGWAVRAVGAPGTVAGTTDPGSIPAAPEPAAFTAITRNEYAVPFTSPVTVVEVEVTPLAAVVQVEPTSRSTVYD
jgi:hypothetical protein